MDYRTITNKSSTQYKMQQQAYTGACGHRMIGDRVMIALAFMPLGSLVNLKTSEGHLIKAIVGDIKADTDCLHPDGSMVEFIIMNEQLDRRVSLHGSFNEIYEGTIVKVIEIKKP